jgi:hypothetical protein
MSNKRVFAFSALAAAMALAPLARAQSVISTHSGIVHFLEGGVFLDNQLLESRLGKYPAIPKGSELRTEDGRAEVLLTPGVFLRMGDHSAIRMVANDLGDTQVQLAAGAVIVDSGEPNADTSVTLIYRDWRVHFLEKGIYRVDSDPARLMVREGSAEAFEAAAGTPVHVESGFSLPFAGVLVSQRSGVEPFDALSDWSKGRGQSIVADNSVTAQIDEDPASQTLDADALTYFPMIGLPPGPGVTGPGSSYPYLSGYGTVTPSQPGFSAIYLPGYAYRPPLFAPSGVGIRTFLSSPSRGIVILPTGRPGVAMAPPGLLHPGTPVIGPRPVLPVRVAPGRPAPSFGVHAGHR